MTPSLPGIAYIGNIGGRHHDACIGQGESSLTRLSNHSNMSHRLHGSHGFSCVTQDRRTNRRMSCALQGGGRRSQITETAEITCLGPRSSIAGRLPASQAKNATPDMSLKKKSSRVAALFLVLPQGIVLWRRLCRQL